MVWKYLETNKWERDSCQSTNFPLSYFRFMIRVFQTVYLKETRAYSSIFYFIFILFFYILFSVCFSLQSYKHFRKQQRILIFYFRNYKYAIRTPIFQMLGNKIKSLYYKTSPTTHIKLLFSIVFLYPKAWDICLKPWDIYFKV